MLYQHNHILDIIDGPCRQDLAVAWCYAKDKRAKLDVVFTDSNHEKRTAKILSLTYATDTIIKIEGEVQWWAPNSRPNFRVKMMQKFTGTYNTSGRSGQFEIPYHTADDR